MHQVHNIQHWPPWSTNPSDTLQSTRLTQPDFFKGTHKCQVCVTLTGSSQKIKEPTSKGSSLRKSKNWLQNLPQRFSSLRKSENLSKKFKNLEPEVLIETKNHPTLDYTYTYCAVWHSQNIHCFFSNLSKSRPHHNLS